MCETSELRAVLAALQSSEVGTDERDQIDRIRLCEEVKAAAAALQALETQALVTSRRAERAAAGVKPDLVSRGIASEVGLARRISPWHAQRYVAAVMVMPTELPETFAALRAGRTTESRALTMARETVFLSRADRATVDAQLAPQLERWGDRRVEAEARKAAYRLDPAGAVERARSAAKDRRVGLRPAPDCMARLTALLPVAQGVAAYAALKRTADSLIGTGEAGGRNRGQVMADTLVERLTGQAHAEDVPVEVDVIMTDTAIFAGPDVSGRDEPAHLRGYGPIPAAIARELVLRPNTDVPRWLRRLYQAPVTKQLVAMDSRRRCFTPAQRRFLQLRDQTCRTPWCDAPVEHADHVTDYRYGGATSLANGQGYCAACNYAKSVFGWQAVADRFGTIVIETPTGHRYRSDPPDPPGSPSGYATRRTRRFRPRDAQVPA